VVEADLNPIGKKAMSGNISTETLDEMEKRCGDATPGPWESFIEDRDMTSGSSFIRTGRDDIYLTGATPADQDFIAHARQDVLALIQEVRALRRSIS
jgi:hypothetical protein